MKPAARKQTCNYDDKLGVVHLEGVSAHDSTTLCGHCWTFAQYEDTTEPVNCPQCLNAAAEIAKVLRAAIKSGQLKGAKYYVPAPRKKTGAKPK